MGQGEIVAEHFSVDVVSPPRDLFRQFADEPGDQSDAVDKFEAKPQWEFVGQSAIGNDKAISMEFFPTDGCLDALDYFWYFLRGNVRRSSLGLDHMKPSSEVTLTQG